MEQQNGIAGNGVESVPVAQKLTAKDFASGADVRWCPGCGDYSILAQVQRTLPELEHKHENYVFISGIGCSSRFPYYMNGYGFHGIHGRAMAIATGVKMANPELAVWVATGDGDGLSIGGNHMLHTLRRNIDCVVLLFNNRIYGLTKGQLSPTSESGKRTKSSPFGSIDHPVNPVLVALGAEATFVARTIDRDPKHQQQTLLRAAAHHGSSFVEIYQNCNIFNDGAYEHLSDKKVKDDNLIAVEHGKPMVFGINQDKGIKLDHFRPRVVSLTDGTHSIDDLLVYDETEPELAYIVGRLGVEPGFPTAIGVFLSIERPTYEDLAYEQVEQVTAKLGKGDLTSLLHEGETWRIE